MRAVRLGIMGSLFLGLLVHNLAPLTLEAAMPVSPSALTVKPVPPAGRGTTFVAPSTTAPSTGFDVVLTINDASISAAAAASPPTLTITSALANRTASPIIYLTGCNVAPNVHLSASSGPPIYRLESEVNTTASGDTTCVPTERVVAPRSGTALSFVYALAGIPDDTYVLRERFTYTVQTGDRAARYVTLSDGSRLDTFPTTHTEAAPVGIDIRTGTAAARTARTVPEPNSSVTGPFYPQVLVIDYDTRPNGADDGSSALTSQLINALGMGSKYHNETASAANFQIARRYVEHNGEPLIPGCDPSRAVCADYQAIFRRFNICQLANSGAIDFVWIWEPGTESDPVYGNTFLEWVTTGPLYNQTYGSNVPTCNRTLPTFAFNYDRAIGEATHSFSHYAENILQYGFGPANYGGPGGADMYDQFDGQIYRYNGVNPPLNTTRASCGDVHFPPNTTTTYDYSNATVVQSNCATYNPGNPGAERYVPVSADTWRGIPCDPSVRNWQFECDQQSFLMWWMQNRPGYNNHVLDANYDQMPNWWQYLCALDTVVAGIPIPTITGVTPNGAPTSGGTSVTITGTNFPGGLRVGFGLDANNTLIEPTNVVHVNSTTITAITPAHALGTVTVFVCTGDYSTCGQLANGFTYATIMPQPPHHLDGLLLETPPAPLPPRHVEGTTTPGGIPGAQPVRH